MQKYSTLMSLYAKENPEYFQLAVDSMLCQTVPPDEIVIVKDGPITEELQTKIDGFVEKHKSLFTIIGSKQNQGLGKALNLGLKHCRNDLVARMDTDDISKPNRCEEQLKKFESDKELVLVGSAIDEFTDNPKVVISRRVVPIESQDIYNFAKRRSAFNHPTVMYKRSNVLKYGGYADLRRNQDVDLFGRMLYGGCKAANLEESLLLFRSNANLAKRRKSWENTWSYIATIKKFWEMGYSNFNDFTIVFIAQTTMFLCPISVQSLIYKRFLRK